MMTLQQEVNEIKARLDCLEARVRQLAEEKHEAGLQTPDELLTPEQVLAGLKAEGLVREPTPEERRLAAEWEAVPEEEKQTHTRLMHGLVLDPPLSQIIIENRG